MSITAFPVLARIVQERGLTKTRLGSIAITCAAADDITAWCLLAAVIAVVKAGSLASAGYTILLATGYVFLMLKLVRPFLHRIGELYATKERMSKPVVGIFFITLLLSAWSTEIIGIHALFGAFMAGVIMPANVNFRNIFIEKVEDVAQVLLLPLFFVFTGLRTQIGLLNEPGLWQLCLIVVLVAVTGKFIGSALAARFVGESWHGSLTIGALMNTRGLMELVALNIGYDLGVLSPEMFAILVLMALVTTFMTGPALDLINKVFKTESTSTDELQYRGNKYNVLISFSHPHTGKLLLRLANMLTRKSTENATVTAMHLSLGNELNSFNSVEYEKESFELLKEESKTLDQAFLPLFKPVSDIDEEITEVANSGDYDLLLVGMGRSVFEGTLLGRILGFTSRVINPEKLYDSLTGREGLFTAGTFDERINHIVKTVTPPVGILVDKGLDTVERVLIPVFSHSDSFLLIYIQKLIHNSGVQVSVFDAMGIIKNSLAFKESIRSIALNAPNHLQVIEASETRADVAFFKDYDLLLIGLESWKKVLDKREEWLSAVPSVLIMKS